MTGFNPPGTFPFAVNLAQTFSSLLTIAYGSRLSLQFRISFCMFVITGILLTLPILTTQLQPAPAYWSVICLLGVFGLFTGAA